MHTVNEEIGRWFALSALALIACTGLCALTNISASGIPQFYPRSNTEYLLIGGISCVLSVLIHWNAPSWKSVLGSNLGFIAAWLLMTWVVPWLQLNDITLMLVCMSNAAVVAWIVFLSKRAYISFVLRIRV